MGSRSSRKRMRGERGQRDRERDFLFITWGDAWGRPPAVVWWAAWLVGGPIAAFGFVGAIVVAVSSVLAVASEGVWTLIGLPAAALLALATFVFLWVPLRRFHGYCRAWNSQGQLSSAYRALHDTGEDTIDDGGGRFPRSLPARRSSRRSFASR